MISPDTTRRDAEHLVAGISEETLRQQQLLAAIFTPQFPGEPSSDLHLLQPEQTWPAGIAAYRGNGLGHATAALRIQFPTILAMLGNTAFEAVCVRHWRTRPPEQGDLAKVGNSFAQTITEIEELTPWPWLTDCARLDWAHWHVLFDPPTRLTEMDLNRLITTEPTALRIHLATGTRLISSPWPIVTLRQLHHLPETDSQALQTTLQQPGEHAWVWREDFEAHYKAIATSEAAWISALQSCSTLDAAFDATPGEMDVSAWLHNATIHGWIDHVEAF